MNGKNLEKIIKEVILLKIDMLEVKKDRVKEIDKQLRKMFISKGNSKLWQDRALLKIEKLTLLQEIKDIESKRGASIEKQI